jgi:hypothetical protein
VIVFKRLWLVDEYIDLTSFPPRLYLLSQICAALSPGPRIKVELAGL